MLWQRGRAYAQDLRERVFATADTGLPVGRIAERLHVSISYVSKVLGRRRTTGETAARPRRCHIPRKLTGQFAAIQQQVQTHPDATIEELCTWLKETHKVSASATLMWETLAHLNLTQKKDPARRGAEPPGRGQGPHRMAREPTRPEPGKADLHR